MAVNPVGYVPITDGGVPRTVSAIAFETITGGQLCFASGAADNVSSGLNSFASTDIGAALGASGAKFNGVALQDAVSGGYVGLVTRGIIIARAGGTIVNGQPVAANGSDDFIPLAATSGADVPTMVTASISAKAGRAWSSATSGNYALIELTP